MTKTELQKEILAKVKPGTKPSDIKRLKRSKSDGDIPTAPPSPVTKIRELENQVKFHSETAQNYLKNLQTSQAKAQLLTDQLTSKQKEIEELRKKLESQPTLRELDCHLTARHQNLKDWWKQYSKSKKLDQELEENIDYASEELVGQDEMISALRKENFKLKQTNQSLQKDLNLVTKLATSRKVPLPTPTQNFWKGIAIGSVLGISFYFLNNAWKPNFKDNYDH